MQLTQEYLYKESATPQTRANDSNLLEAWLPVSKRENLNSTSNHSSMIQSHGRTIDPIRGIGFGDQIAELVPGLSEPVTLSFTRTTIWTAGLMQVFGYAGGVDGLVRSLKHHRWPLDIKQEAVTSQLEQQIAQRSQGTAPSSLPNLRAISRILKVIIRGTPKN